MFAIPNVDTICEMLQQAKVRAIEYRNIHLQEKDPQ